MQVKEVMTVNPETLDEKESLLHAAEKMKRLNVGLVPIVKEGAVCGVVTDRDIVLRAIAEKRDPETTPVREVMSKAVACCRENEDVKKCLGVMGEKKIRRLIVTDDRGKAVGVLSLGDIATKTHELGYELLMRISEPSRPNR